MLLRDCILFNTYIDSKKTWEKKDKKRSQTGREGLTATYFLIIICKTLMVQFLYFSLQHTSTLPRTEEMKYIYLNRTDSLGGPPLSSILFHSYPSYCPGRFSFPSTYFSSYPCLISHCMISISV